MLRFKPFHFPVEWKFQDPDTGALFKAINKKALVTHIVTYRQQNQLDPIEHLDLVLENYLCNQKINQGGCMPLTLKRDLLAYIKGGMVLLKSTVTNNFVAQGRADKRSLICRDCPNNFFPQKTPAQALSDKVAEVSIGTRRSVAHNEIGNCMGCHCPLKSKVWVPPPFSLLPNQETQMRAVKPACWCLPENANI